MGLTDTSRLGEALLPAVLEAGRIEMRHFTGGVAVEKKADKSPVTAADREAEAVILAALANLLPDVPVVAEEAAAAGHFPDVDDRYLLVDALDGTNLFIRGKPEFSVNIALVEHGKPVFGLVYVPPTGSLYLTRPDGFSYTTVMPPETEVTAAHSYLWSKMASRLPDPQNLVAFNSRTGGVSAEFLQELGVKEARPIGSSIKFCLIAAGEGDIYARFGITYEWDTAAGQAILEAAGGSVTTLDGHRLGYGKSAAHYLNPHFVAWGRKPLLTRA